MLGEDFTRLVKAMDAEGMAGDLKDVDWPSQSAIQPQENIECWEETMIRYFMNYTKAELHEKALELNLMLFPVNDPKDVLEYRQLTARDYWVEKNHPELGSVITYPGAFFKSSETSCQIRCRAPLIGEHNQAIYEDELGLSKQELTILKEASII